MNNPIEPLTVLQATAFFLAFGGGQRHVDVRDAAGEYFSGDEPRRSIDELNAMRGGTIGVDECERWVPLPPEATEAFRNL